MSQWAEVRHLHLVEGVAKKQIARRLQLDIKTVRRAVEQPLAPVRVSSPRVRSLDPWREQIAQWLAQDRRVTAKRIRRLLLPLAGPVAARTVRRYVAALRAATARKEGYVHRSVRAGTTMEVDFGESWAEVAGVPCKVKYLVATLPYSNVYFAKAYPIERLESLLRSDRAGPRGAAPRSVLRSVPAAGGERCAPGCGTTITTGRTPACTLNRPCHDSRVLRDEQRV